MSTVPLTTTLDWVARKLAAARRVVVLTGAGISAESGLRTFRGATEEDLPADMRALWKEFDPQKLATPQAFEADPAGVSRWYDWRRVGCLAAIPNPGHVALAEMERIVVSNGGTFTLLTQNVDRLHQRAGSQNVVEIHGSIIEWRCTETGRKYVPEESAFAAYPIASPFSAGAILRPDVVWFGEMLPESALKIAAESCSEADLFFSIGTSSVVQPAAFFIQWAREACAFTVEVNVAATAISRTVDAALVGSASSILPELVARALSGTDV